MASEETKSLLNKRTILIAVDNTDASERAVNWTLENLYKEGDELRLLHVVPMPVPQGMPLVLDMALPAFPVDPDPAEDIRHVNEAKKFIMRRFGNKLAEKNIPFSVQIAHYLTDEDSIGQAICRRAKALNAAAVVMCKHQRGMIKEFFMGSAAKYCTVHCQSPLVVLH